MVIDVAAPIAAYYGLRAAGAGVWTALAAGAALPAAVAVAGLVRNRHLETMGILTLTALALSSVLAVATGSPRTLLARDGLLTAAWACYLYATLLAARPAPFVISRPLLEGRRVYDLGSRRWVRPSAASWDELWWQLPQFWRILRDGTPAAENQ